MRVVSIVRAKDYVKLKAMILIQFNVEKSTEAKVLVSIHHTYHISELLMPVLLILGIKPQLLQCQVIQTLLLLNSKL